MSADEAPTNDVVITGHLHTFPPFPKPLPGRELPPFKSFESAGYVINPDKSVPEVDGLGIDTAKLRVKHTGGVDGSRKKKKKKKGLVVQRDEAGRQLPWWEIWAEDEDTRAPAEPYDDMMDDAERLHQAAADFFSGRKWPSSETPIHSVWAQIKLFIGAEILGSAGKASDKTGEAKAGEDDMDDDDEDAAWGVKPSQSSTAETVKPMPALEESGIEDILDGPTPEEIRTNTFLAEPVYSLRMFFSSFFIDRGMIWSKPKSHQAPKLFRFFLEYIVRNKLMRSKETLARLNNALTVCDEAEQQFAAIWDVGAVVNIKVSEAFINLWGKKVESTVIWGDVPAVEDSENEQAEPVSKDAELIDAEDMLKYAATREGITDNLDGQAVVIDAPADPDGGGWGETTWSTADAEGSRWGVDPPKTSEEIGWANAHLDRPAAWGNWESTAEGENAADTWTPNPPTTITDLLGPSNLPVTHRSGIVEQSVRRVKAVLLSGAELPPTTDDASAVETQMLKKFTRIVFAPWKASSDEYALRPEGKSDVIPPKTLSTSVGRVVPEVPGHDMEKDDIEVLMDADVADKFALGMGFIGTWVQIARNEDEGGEPGRLWYMESNTQYLPSYYVNCPY